MNTIAGYLIKSEKELRDAARWFITQMGKSKVFAFSGNLGAGKTTFIKAICKELEVAEDVSSPTFALVYEYFSNTRGTIYHLDLYRITDVEELYDMGYEDYIYSGDLCFIEWPEIASDLLPGDAVKLKIEVNPDDSRKIIVNP